MSDINATIGKQVSPFRKKNLDRLSTLLGGNRIPFQLIIGSTLEEVMRAAAALGAPNAEPFEAMLAANGIAKVEPVNTLSALQRFKQINDLLIGGISGVYVIVDTQAATAPLQVIRNHALPEKLAFLVDELWLCQDNIATPVRNRGDTLRPIDLTAV